MQNKQQGIISPIVIVIIVIAVLGVGGYVAYTQYSKKITEEQVETDTENTTNDQQETNTNETTTQQQTEVSEQPSVTVISPNGGEIWQIGTTQTVKYNYNIEGAGTCIDVFVVNSVEKKFLLGGQYVSINNYTFSLNPGSVQYDKLNNVPVGRYKIEINVYYCAGTNNTPIASDTSDDYFNIVAAEQNSAPKINSISPTSGAIGTLVEIKGEKFTGFEGDLNVWIENSNGIKGIIYGDKASSNNNLIKFILPVSVCQQDTSYSGLPCPAQLNLVSGNYKLYVNPWGTKSNIVNFEIK
jgi:Tfp pilus assembly protein PilE